MSARIAAYLRQHHLGLIAIFVALSGTAYAANQIGAADIKPDAVRGKHIRDGQVAGADVGDDTLTGADVDEGTLTGVDADTLDGESASAFLPANGKAADADLLDGLNSTAFLGASAKAADSNLLDGLDSAAFLGANAKAADSDLLDGQDSSSFLGASAKSADADKLDGIDGAGYARIVTDASTLTAPFVMGQQTIVTDEIATIPGLGRFDARCSSSGGSIDTEVSWTNTTSGTIDSWRGGSHDSTAPGAIRQAGAVNQTHWLLASRQEPPAVALVEVGKAVVAIDRCAFVIHASFRP